AGGILALVFGPEVPEAEMRGEARQGQERRAPLAEEDRLLARGERQQLAEAVHAGGPGPEGGLADRLRHPREVVVNGQHLAAVLTHRQEPPGLVAAAADGALDVGDERHRDVARISAPFSFSVLATETILLAARNQCLFSFSALAAVTILLAA